MWMPRQRYTNRMCLYKVSFRDSCLDQVQFDRGKNKFSIISFIHRISFFSLSFFVYIVFQMYICERNTKFSDYSVPDAIMFNGLGT